MKKLEDRKGLFAIDVILFRGGLKCIPFFGFFVIGASLQTPEVVEWSLVCRSCPAMYKMFILTPRQVQNSGYIKIR